MGSTLDLRSLIRENLLRFRTFHDGLKDDQQRRFQVQVYDTAPLAAYYRWDQRALISFFPVDRSSVDTTQYETSVNSNFAQFVEKRFYESWLAPNTRTLQQYFTLPVTIIRDGGEPRLDAEWVVLEDRIYLAHPVLTEHAVDSGVDQLQVHLDHDHVPSFVGGCAAW